MKVLDDILLTLDYDVPIRDIRQGVFHTGVWTRHCGLASTLPRDALRQEDGQVREPGVLLERSAQDLARMAYSKSILEAAIGMAAVNSLLQVDESVCRELNAADLILEKGRGKNVVVIGHFPFLPRIRDRVKNLWVLEKNPQAEDLREQEADQIIPEGDVVAVTGTALTNHTLPHILELCSPSAFVILLGDTVPLTPVLFDYGIAALSGTRVTNPDLALRCVSQGATFRQIKGIRKLTWIKA